MEDDMAKKAKQAATPQPEEENQTTPQETTSETPELPSRETELEEALKAAQAQSDEYLALAQRVQADFDNFRRRNASVRAESFEDGARALLKLLLPTLDNLERALQTETADEKLHEGVKLVYRQLCEMLEKRGVTVIDRLGEKFDPNLENAVMQGTPEDGEPGSVCCVLQKGYKLGDHVLRHAMVKVVPA